MAGPTVPPQAYTRDTLVQAYEWLKLQPQGVKERATSADTLIGLYFQAKRYPHLPLTQSSPNAQPTAAANSAPSSQAFAADLKNLAENIRQFEADDFGPGHPATSFAEPKPSEPKPEPRAAQESLAPAKPIIQAPAANSPGGIQPGQGHPNEKMSFAGLQFLQDLDPTTRELLKSTQLRLNLSSEAEALRILVTLGSEKLRLLDRG